MAVSLRGYTDSSKLACPCHIGAGHSYVLYLMGVLTCPSLLHGYKHHKNTMQGPQSPKLQSGALPAVKTAASTNQTSSRTQGAVYSAAVRWKRQQK